MKDTQNSDRAAVFWRSEEILNVSDHIIFCEFLCIQAYYTSLPLDCWMTKVHAYTHFMWKNILSRCDDNAKRAILCNWTLSRAHTMCWWLARQSKLKLVVIHRCCQVCILKLKGKICQGEPIQRHQDPRFSWFLLLWLWLAFWQRMMWNQTHSLTLLSSIMKDTQNSERTAVFLRSEEILKSTGHIIFCECLCIQAYYTFCPLIVVRQKSMIIRTLCGHKALSTWFLVSMFTVCHNITDLHYEMSRTKTLTRTHTW